jgi:hypothetical protein
VLTPIDGAFIEGDCTDLTKVGEVEFGVAALIADVAIAAD